MKYMYHQGKRMQKIKLRRSGKEDNPKRIKYIDVMCC